MNRFSGYPVAIMGGYHAMLRLAEDGQAEPILGEGGKPVLYQTEAEAWRAIARHLLKYFNGHYRRSGPVLSAAMIEAERVFRPGKKPVAVEVRRAK